MKNNQNAEEKRPLSALQDILGYHFHDERILRRALRHSSYIDKAGEWDCYERIEYLGDAVLELVVTDYLFRKYHEMEGELTQKRAILVCEKSLSTCARDIGLGDFLSMSKGEDKQGGRDRDSMLCDTFESMLGAVYLDSSLEEAKKIIDRCILDHAEEIIEANTDFKSVLQERLQNESEELPQYVVVKEEGPDHAKIFTMELRYKGEVLAVTTGESKKKAAQAAAKMVLEQLNK